MNKTKHPCRQLNSKAIQSAALCFVSPIIVGKCSIVKAQCVCKIDEGGLQKAWNDACLTRDACDKAICGKNLLFNILCFFSRLQKFFLLKNDVHIFSTGVRNVAFFFGAISAQGPKKSRGKKAATVEEYESDESNDEALTSSQVASTASQNWIADYPTIVNEKLCPCINYWIALTTPNGAPANPLVIHRALLECDVETVAQQVLIVNVQLHIFCSMYFMNRFIPSYLRLNPFFCPFSMIHHQIPFENQLNNMHGENVLRKGISIT